MKYKFQTGFLMLVCATAALAQAPLFQNDAVINCPPQVPPQINATTFINNNTFNINFTNFTLAPQPYKTANTLNYTNRGWMEGNTGFTFDTSPTSTGQRRMADNFNNTGTIRVGSIFNPNQFGTNLFNLLPFGLPRLTISAANVAMNSGSNIVGMNGTFSISGKNVDLNRGTVSFEGFETPNIVFGVATNDTTGIFDNYWTTNGIVGFFSPNEQFLGSIPTTPQQVVFTRPNDTPITTSFSLTGALAYTAFGTLNATAGVAQVVFVRNTRPGVNINIYQFLGAYIAEWENIRTNYNTGEVSTNYLYMQDTFATFHDFRNDGVISFPPSLVRTFNPDFSVTARPSNYSFHRSELNKLNFGTPWPVTPFQGPFLVQVFPDAVGYRARFAPTTIEPMTVPNQSLSNLTSKVDITVDGILNLTKTRILGPNYLLLRSTNHFTSSAGANIVSPFNDIDLASTNGILNITNLVKKTVPRLEGDVTLWSGRWFADTGAGRLSYNVLFIDSQINPIAETQVQDLNLRSVDRAGGPDSVVISDPLKVTRNFKIDTGRLTISTNKPPSPEKRGEINLSSSTIRWSDMTPRLQYFTNNGAHASQNAVFFGGSRTAPYYNSTFQEPYLAFVNTGTVTNEGSLIWANYFQNSGVITMGTGFGAIELESQIARMTNGSFFAPRGDVSIKTGELTATNQTIVAGRKLTLSATSRLSDTGGRDANTWSSGNGFDLLAQPNNGDLLGTTIIDNAGIGSEVTHVWAGQDRGNSVAGFANNAALGRLVLDGGTINGGAASLFTFSPVSGQNALYVDAIEFRDYDTSTIIDTDGNVQGVQIDPGMKIYYAQALGTNGSVAERINGANGGRFVWVASYTGFYSSTNIVIDGVTNVINAALAQSCNLDTDGDGLPNCIDPTPILTPTTLALRVVMTNAPTVGATLSWNSMPNSTNRIFFRNSPLSGDWQPLTNFVNPSPAIGRLSIFDPKATNMTRYYRVQVDVQQP